MVTGSVVCTVPSTVIVYGGVPPTTSTTISLFFGTWTTSDVKGAPPSVHGTVAMKPPNSS